MERTRISCLLCAVLWILVGTVQTADKDKFDPLFGLDIDLASYKKSKWPYSQRRPHPDMTHPVKGYKLDKYGNRKQPISTGIYKVDVNDFPHDLHDHLPDSHYPSGAQLVFFPDWHPPQDDYHHRPHNEKPRNKLRQRRKTRHYYRRSRPQVAYGPPPKPRLTKEPEQPQSTKKTGYLVMFERMVQDMMAEMHRHQEQRGYGSQQQPQPTGYENAQQQHMANFAGHQLLQATYEPMQQQQAGQQQAYGSAQPMQQQPSYGSGSAQPMQQQPSYGSGSAQPMQQQPSYGDPQAMQQPSYGSSQPMEQQPAYGNPQPMQQQPSYGNSEPVQQSGYGNPQPMQQPTYGHPQPMEQQPSYGSQQSIEQQPTYVHPQAMQELGMDEQHHPEQQGYNQQPQIHPASFKQPELSYHFVDQQSGSGSNLNMKWLQAEALNAPSSVDLAQKIDRFAMNTLIHAVRDPGYRQSLLEGKSAPETKDMSGLLVFEQRVQRPQKDQYGNPMPQASTQSTQGILVLPDPSQRPDPNSGILVVAENQESKHAQGFLGVQQPAAMSTSSSNLQYPPQANSVQAHPQPQLMVQQGYPKPQVMAPQSYPPHVMAQHSYPPQMMIQQSYPKPQMMAQHSYPQPQTMAQQMYPEPSGQKTETRTAALVFRQPANQPAPSGSYGPPQSGSKVQNGFLLLAPEQQQRQQNAGHVMPQNNHVTGYSMTMTSPNTAQLPGVLVIPVDETGNGGKQQQQQKQQYPNMLRMGGYGKSSVSSNNIPKRPRFNPGRQRRRGFGPNRRRMRKRKPFKMSISMRMASSKEEDRPTKQRYDPVLAKKRHRDDPLRGVILPDKFRHAKEKLIMYY